MALLAIKGHPTRGNEVIEILKMLGGSNPHAYTVDTDSLCFFINKNTNIIYYIWVNNCYEDEDILVFTLEEFLERFPYKVGDKVSILDGTNYVFTIKSMTWDTDQVKYKIKAIDDIENEFDWLADELLYYTEPKEETMENKLDLLQQLKDYFDNTPREVVEKEWHEYDKYNEIGPTVNEYLEYVNKIRQPQYPKTYEECCRVLGKTNSFCFEGISLDEVERIKPFIKLLRCRDAYWKISGEQMGLGKPWEPDLENEELYCIQNYNNQIVKSKTNTAFNKILIFPTEEMRDAFYENFKELIEKCKELL